MPNWSFLFFPAGIIAPQVLVSRLPHHLIYAWICLSAPLPVHRTEALETHPYAPPPSVTHTQIQTDTQSPTSLAGPGRGEAARPPLALLFLFGLDVQDPVDRLLRLRQGLLGEAGELRGVEPAHLPRWRRRKPGPMPPLPQPRRPPWRELRPASRSASTAMRGPTDPDRAAGPSGEDASSLLKPACARPPAST